MTTLQGAGRGWRVVDSVQAKARQAQEHLLQAQSALAAVDFEQSRRSFAEAEVELAEARQELDGALANSGTILRWLDVTGTYRSGDALLAAGEAVTAAGQEISAGLTTLFASRLGAEGSGDTGTLIEALQESQWAFKRAVELLVSAETSMKQIEPGRLPDEVAGPVADLGARLPRIREFLETFVNQSDLLLAVLGAERERQYLLLLANNHELRPTGGFIGSIGLVNIDRGVVENIDVSTVYDPDGQLKEFIAPPNPLLPITDRWYMRDANWFVDYSLNARKIATFFEKEGGPTVDGVILITPEVIRNLLTLTGPVQVPGYDTEVSAENFYAVTQAQVTYEYDRSLNRPKQFLADLTPVLLNKILGEKAAGEESGLDNNLQFLSALQRAGASKDLLIYLRDEELQKKIVAANLAGTVPASQPGFLHVNNANIGGHKSDQFMEQEIDYRSEVTGSGDVEVTLTIRRTHKGPQERLDYDYPPGEDPSVKDNIVYQRVLVPPGAKLLDVKGFASFADVPRRIEVDEELPLTVDPDIAAWQQAQQKHETGTVIGEEAGYMMFANWMITKPGETTVGLYRYRLPQHVKAPGVIDSAARYSVYIAKQSGQGRTTVRASLDLPNDASVAHVVPEEGITRHDGNEIVYRGDLTRDVLVGAVFE